MKPEHHKYALAEVPRYTSYPTAVQFHDGVGEADYRLWLSQIDDGEPLSLYVHIPFCQKMCWYCGCHTSVAHTYDRVGTYAQDLQAEIDLLAAAVPVHHGGLAHVHFGGGQPHHAQRYGFCCHYCQNHSRLWCASGDGTGGRD
ncbi:MAG: hypothetical protein Q9M45_06880 [Robiginitomaculum sp.]|nr:hypothetical protein [Robiginitomaculum sp.]